MTQPRAARRSPMSTLWAAIDVSCRNPRILVTNAGREPILKARMLERPSHPRALSTLLEGLAMWENRPVRAALVVGEQAGYGSSQFLDCVADPWGTALYSIDVVASLSQVRQRHRDRIEGMGKFGDLKRFLATEVAR
jgi:hypothetical protein